MRKRVLILIGSVALVTGATAVTSTSAALTTRDAVPAVVVGTWGKTITAATWHKYDVGYEPAGRWSIVITKRGLTSIFAPPGTPDGYPLTTMHVVAADAAVVFGPTADGFCTTKASYRWKVSGRTLTFKVVRDECDARRVLMTAGPWARK
jgi:hypothetical protein